MSKLKKRKKVFYENTMQMLDLRR